MRSRWNVWQALSLTCGPSPWWSSSGPSNCSTFHRSSPNSLDSRARCMLDSDDEGPWFLQEHKSGLGQQEMTWVSVCPHMLHLVHNCLSSLSCSFPLLPPSLPNGLLHSFKAPDLEIKTIPLQRLLNQLSHYVHAFPFPTPILLIWSQILVQGCLGYICKFVLFLTFVLNENVLYQGISLPLSYFLNIEYCFQHVFNITLFSVLSEMHIYIS